MPVATRAYHEAPAVSFEPRELANVSSNDGTARRSVEATDAVDISRRVGEGVAKRLMFLYLSAFSGYRMGARCAQDPRFILLLDSIERGDIKVHPLCLWIIQS